MHVPLVVDLTRLYGLALTPAPLVERAYESQRDCMCGHTLSCIGEMVEC